MNILITGSSGFIGSNLIKTLNKLELNIYLLNREIKSIKKNCQNITWINKSLEDLDLNNYHNFLRRHLWKLEVLKKFQKLIFFVKELVCA